MRMKRGAHLRVDPGRIIAERLMWTGLTMVGLAVFALGLFAISQTLSGTFAGSSTPLTPEPITITFITLVIGLALSGFGIVAGSRASKQGRTDSTEESRPKIAA